MPSQRVHPWPTVESKTRAPCQTLLEWKWNRKSKGYQQPSLEPNVVSAKGANLKKQSMCWGYNSHEELETSIIDQRSCRHVHVPIFLWTFDSKQKGMVHKYQHCQAPKIYDEFLWILGNPTTCPIPRRKSGAQLERIPLSPLQHCSLVLPCTLKCSGLSHGKIRHRWQDTAPMARCPEDPNFGDQPFSKSHWKESPLLGNG